MTAVRFHKAGSPEVLTYEGVSDPVGMNFAAASTPGKRAKAESIGADALAIRSSLIRMT